MKEKNKIFFGVKGVTSTSANNIANIAKEVMEESRALLENITFVNCNVGLISSDVSRLTEKGYDTDELKNIVSSINRVAECNALIAYLREAIKAKEEELSYIEGISTTKFLKIKGIEVSDPRNLYNLDLMTEEDAIALLSPQERIDYLILEATAAAIGNRIHPGKSFSEARRKLELKRKEPIKLVGSGSDALVYTYSPSADVDEVNNTIEAECSYSLIRLGADNTCWCVDTGKPRMGGYCNGRFEGKFNKRTACARVIGVPYFKMLDKVFKTKDIEFVTAFKPYPFTSLSL